MLSLPLVAPRDSHELWFGSNRSLYGGGSHGSSDTAAAARRQLHSNNPHSNGHNNNANSANTSTSSRALFSSTAPSDSLAILQLEERAIRLRKENIASFGCAWIKPAGCPKTMLGMREEEAEREEGLAAAAQELNVAAMVAAAGTGGGVAGADIDAFGGDTLLQQQQQQQLMVGEGEGGGEDGDGIGADELERDLDDDIPEAEDGYGDLDDDEGLVEEGEEGYGEGDEVDEDLMERNLDDDIPDGFPEGEDDDDDDDDDEEEDDYDEDTNLHAGDDGIMVRDLDEEIPEAEDEDMNEVEAEEWQHTDSELEDNDDSDLDADDTHDPFAEHLGDQGRPDVGVTANTQTPASVHPRTGSVRRRQQQTSNPHSTFSPLPSTSTRRAHETEAQRRFLQRWSGGGMESDVDVFDTSAITMDDDVDDDLRASITNRNYGQAQAHPAQNGRMRHNQGRFGRFMRRGGPRDSLD